MPHLNTAMIDVAPAVKADLLNVCGFAKLCYLLAHQNSSSLQVQQK